MTCPTCGATNEVGRKFCGDCGTRLASVCASCGTVNAAGTKFCGECGTQLASPTAQPADPGATASTPTVGPTAAGTDAPIASIATRATERRHVSVLFVDLVGFTSLAAARDPEEVRDLLSRYFETAREIVERYGGTIEKFIGDAVMAVWGTPVAQEDDAERAVRTALDLLEAVRGLDSGADGRGLEARAGVLTGEAVVNIGATGQGMVAGDLVNTASRLQSVAPPGTVLVGEATQHAASSAIAFEPVGEHLLKGKAAPVAAWRAVRVVAKRGGEGRSEGLEAPFVGRDDELRLLKDFFHATSRERRARLMSVTGQAGIGKSRLAWEFLKYVDGVLETIWWHEGRSPAFGEGVTFWALGEMVRRRAGLVEGADEATTREHIAATLTEFVPDDQERRQIEPALLALLGFGDQVAAQSRDELFSAWRTFFERVATDHPAVLVFEDLQWADPGLLDFIDHLLEWATSSPIFVITLARPELLERRPDWGAGRRNFVALSIEPLTPAAMRELLAGLVPGLPETAVRAVLDRAGGIPLYAVEIVRMLVAEGKLEAADGVYRPTGDLGDLAVPETLHALIAARLDALEPGDRELLQDGAVLGQTFSLPALAALRGEEPDAIEGRLRALVRREVLMLDTDPRSPERGQFGFAQALLREVAYGTLAKRERRERHLAAARFFEQLGDDQTAGVLATHYLDAYRASPEGEEADAVAGQARIALRAAADRASALGSHEQAIAYLEHARTVSTDPSDEADLLERIGNSATAAGRFEIAEAALRHAVDMRRAGSDQAALARAVTALGATLLADYRSVEALAILEPAYVEFASLGDDASVVALAAQLARGYQLHEEPARAVEWADRALELAERLYLVPVLAESLVTKGGSMAIIGRVWEGIGLVQAGRQLADQHGLTLTSLRAKIGLTGSMTVYDPRGAFEVGREAYQVARRLGLRHAAAIAGSNAAEAALALGEFDAALAILNDAVSLDLEGMDKVAVDGVLIEVLATRGQPTAERLQKLEGLGDESDSVFGATLFLARLWAAMAEGRFGDAREAGLRVAALSGLNRPYSLLYATHAGIRARDAAAARATFDELVALKVRGPGLDAERVALSAGVSALEGSWPEALLRYQEALRALRELELHFDVGLTLLEAVSLAPRGESFARAAAEEARTIFTRLGSTPYLEQLEAVLAETDRAAPATGTDGASAGSAGAGTHAGTGSA